MNYTINEKEHTFTLHEADTSVNELIKLIEKYRGYRIQVNIGETSINLITDSGYNYEYKPGENPYEIIGDGSGKGCIRSCSLGFIFCSSLSACLIFFSALRIRPSSISVPI